MSPARRNLCTLFGSIIYGLRVSNLWKHFKRKGKINYWNRFTDITVIDLIHTYGCYIIVLQMLGSIASILLFPVTRATLTTYENYYVYIIAERVLMRSLLRIHELWMNLDKAILYFMAIWTWHLFWDGVLWLETASSTRCFIPFPRSEGIKNILLSPNFRIFVRVLSANFRRISAQSVYKHDSELAMVKCWVTLFSR